MTRSLLHQMSTCSSRVLLFKSSPHGCPGWRALGPVSPRAEAGAPEVCCLSPSTEALVPRLTLDHTGWALGVPGRP